VPGVAEALFVCVLCLFWGKMTAQEQMKKMLDELMGTQRDGELKI